MDFMQKPKVQVSDADKTKSYFKYYDRPVAGIAPEKMGKVFGGPMSPMNGIPFVERNSILDGANDEVGYCVLPDGTGYICDKIVIPGATPEMIDWFIAWRGLDPLRFVIVNPELHISSMCMQTCIASDPDRTIQEKYWDTTQVITRVGDMGPMGPPSINYLNYKCPSSVGFDMEKIGYDKETKTLVCGRNYAEGHPPVAAPDYFVCHQVKEVEGGIEVTTRIWYGWTVRYGQSYKALPDGFFMQPMVPMALMIQNATEWANIAAILPQLYAEEKDN